MNAEQNKEWCRDLRVAEGAPITGMVPVRSDVLLAVNAELERLRTLVREYRAMLSDSIQM